MAVLATAGRSAAIRAVAALFDAGDIKFRTSGTNEIAICTFAATAFHNTGAGVETAYAIGADTTAIAGTVYDAQLRKSTTDVILTCTCTLAGNGGDFIFSSLTIGTGDTISVTSLTLTQPAGS